ncbi:DUF4157 domain-containing protein [Actinophytocola sp.]|uniref:eCIS core domain-containing protein n=1 Tax=Actinophytocola sp. TaxID=1872138 RepID=UPI002D4E787B|nr:DUF4157 domain-containing protein [Actinophytocola sp.]HYQ63039.1 DUF4157 domain-containing protein [Actinophytocola sp.]
MSEENPTLGRRLDRQARRTAARAASDPPWAGPLQVLAERLADLPAPDERFARREAAVAEPAWPVQADDRTGAPAAPAVPAGRALPVDVVTRLSRVVGPGVESMRVHDDDAADELARAHRADAVTVGTDVFFQHGRLNPAEPRGFGLLVHEATHVVAGSQRPAGEESLALAREAAVLSGPAPTPGAPGLLTPPVAQHRGTVETAGIPIGDFPAAAPFPAAAAAPPVAPAVLPAGPPMTASVDRPTAPPPTVQQQQSIDVDALRGRIMRDLMRQLRDEYERGG